MTNIMQCIQNMENGYPQLVPRAMYEDAAKEARQFEVERDEARAAIGRHNGNIVLNPKLDPDPFGHHNMSLSYRLRCMGWPEGLS